MNDDIERGPEQHVQSVLQGESLSLTSGNEEPPGTLNERIGKEIIETEQQGLEAITPSEGPDDIKRSLKNKILGGTVLGLAFAAIAFEQTPANESIRISQGFDLLNKTGSPLAVGAYVAGLTLAIETAASYLTATGFHYEKERTQKVINWFKKLKPEDHKEEVDQEDKNPSKTRQAIVNGSISLGLGSAVLLAKERFVNPKREFSDDIKTATKSSVFIAGFSGAIGSLVAYGASRPEKNEGDFVDQLTIAAADWKVWATIFGSAYLVDRNKDRIKTALGKSKHGILTLTKKPKEKMQKLLESKKS